MGIKRYGRLAGSTQAESALDLVTGPGSPTPFETVEPATKLFAYGEGVTSLGVNRAIGAISANQEDVLTLLDLPTSKGELLEPETTAGTYGFTALKDVDPSVVLNLGSGAKSPTAWVMLGIHKNQFPNFFQMSPALAEGELGKVPVIVRPEDVFACAADSPGTSYFPTPVYGASPEHSSPENVPPISHVKSDLPPYSGAVSTPVVGTWDTDGCRLAGGVTWSSLHARPGCYVHIMSGAQQGLYLIANITNNKPDVGDNKDKAVLVHGLHRIVMDSHNLLAGDRVIWSRKAGDGTAANQTNSAHIMFVDGTTLYLSTFSGSLDVTDAATPYKSGAAAGSVNMGLVGYQENEVTGNPSGLIQVGTDLRGPGGRIGDVASCIPAGSPLRFTPGAGGQNARVCNPPGFLLNPVLKVPAAMMPGPYRVLCRTLTTAREKLRSGSLSSTKGVAFDAAMQQFTGLYQESLETGAQLRKTGYQPVVPYDQTAPGNSFSPSSRILGEGMWKVTVDDVVGGKPTLEAAGFLAGMVLTLLSPLGAGASTLAHVEHIDGNVLWLSGVTNALWGSQHDRTQPPIAVNSTFTYTDDYKVVSIEYAPFLSGNDWSATPYTMAGTVEVAADRVTLTGTGTAFQHATNGVVPGSVVFTGAGFSVVAEVTSNTALKLVNPVITVAAGQTLVRYGMPFIPGSGLNAAYHAHYSSNPQERGNGGSGRAIQMIAGRPLTLQGTAADTYGLEIRTTGNNLAGGIGGDTKTMYLLDGNTAGGVDLSSAADTKIETAILPTNILGALNSSGYVVYQGFLNSLVEGCNLVAGAADGKVTFKANPDNDNLVMGSGGLNNLPDQVDWAPDWNALGGVGFYYLVWGSGGLAWRQDHPTAATPQTVLWRVTVTKPGANYIVADYQDLRRPLWGTQEQVDIQVGGPFAHFSTVGEATDFINAISTGSGTLTRKYRILVRGSTTETSSIKIRTSGVVIEGVPGDVAGDGAAAVITWGGNFELFDIKAGTNAAGGALNPPGNLVFRDLSLRYDTASGSASTISRIAFVFTGIIKNLLIDNVTITAAQATRLHGYVQNPSGALFGAKIQNCSWSGATEFGIHAALLQDVSVVDCVFNSDNTTQNGATQGGTELGTSGGMYVSSSNNLTIRGVIFRNWGNRGVVLVSVSGNAAAWIDSCQIVGGEANAKSEEHAAYGAGILTPYIGIELQSGCNDVWVVNNFLADLGAAGTNPIASHGWGVWSAADRVVLNGNNANVAATTNVGIELTAASSGCMVDMNRTWGDGRVIAGSGHSIGPSNQT